MLAKYFLSDKFMSEYSQDVIEEISELKIRMHELEIGYTDSVEMDKLNSIRKKLTQERIKELNLKLIYGKKEDL